MFKSILKALLSLFVRKAVESAPEAVEVVREQVKKGK